jgi:hypothetical protein
MKKKMICSFLTVFTYITLIYYYNVTLAEIIQSENFPKVSSPSKQSQPQRNLSPPNALPRERRANVRKNLVKGYDLKRFSFLGCPTKPIIALPTHPSGIQNIEERGDGVHLPIMHQPSEVNVPMSHIIANTPKVSHYCIPIPCKAK